MNEKKLFLEKVKKLYPNEPIVALAEGCKSYAFEFAGSIVRIPKDKTSENEYRGEAIVLNYLRGIIKSTKIPSIKIVPEPFFHTIHKKIEGDLWDGGEYVKKNEIDRDRFANDCAVFIAELHTSDINAVSMELRSGNLELADIRVIRDDIVGYLSKDFSTNEVDKIIKFTDTLYSLPDDDTRLVHNDLYYDNIIVNNNYRLAGIIDFANCGRYNYHFDLRKITSYELGESDLWERITKFYERITGKNVDIDTIRIIDIYNYINFLIFYAKDPAIKEDKLNVRANWDVHINYIKNKMKGYKIV